MNTLTLHKAKKIITPHYRKQRKKNATQGDIRRKLVAYRRAKYHAAVTEKKNPRAPHTKVKKNKRAAHKKEKKKKKKTKSHSLPANRTVS